VIHFRSVTGPGNAVGNLETGCLFLDLAIGRNAIERGNWHLFRIVIHGADPERAVRPDLAIIGAAVDPVFNATQRRTRIGFRIKEKDILAQGHDNAALIGQPETTKLAVKGPCLAKARGNIKRVQFAIKDVCPVKPIVGRIPIGAFRQSESLITENFRLIHYTTGHRTLPNSYD